MKIPPYLKKGDTIQIVTPAGYMATENAETCIKVLQEDWGFKVKVGSNLGSSSTTYFSGTAKERLAEMQEALDNPEVNAILCARGGYGASMIVDDLDFKKFKKNPKWLIGFSDITVLHCHLSHQLKTASLHAPMAAAFNNGGEITPYVLSLKKALTGKLQKYSCAPHTLNKTGIAEGQLVGGNLSLLAHVIGTASDFDTKGKILFIEDVGEYIYSSHRMLLQLQRAGKLDKLAGLIIGGFTDEKDTTRPFGCSVYEAFSELLEKYDYPVCYNFPVSHATENYALKVGGRYQLKITSKKVGLAE